MAKVLVEIRGGALVGLAVCGPVKVYVADWDNIEQGEKPEDFEIGEAARDSIMVAAFEARFKEVRARAKEAGRKNLEMMGAA